MVIKLLCAIFLIALPLSQAQSPAETYAYDSEASYSVEDDEGQDAFVEVHALSDDMISRINRVQKNWTVSTV